MGNEQADRPETNQQKEIAAKKTPWSQWLEQKLAEFESELEYEVNGIRQKNEAVRSSLGEESNKVFYRPGLGATGIKAAILGMIGTYDTMIVTDPVYERDKMPESYGGILPLALFHKELTELGFTINQVKVISANETTTVGAEQYESFELEDPEQELHIRCQVNGQEFTLVLTAQDMTQYFPEQFEIVELGRPTPVEAKKTTDPRNSTYCRQLLNHLPVDGAISYNTHGFNPFPPVLDPSMLGFNTILESEQHKSVAQKTPDANPEIIEMMPVLMRLVEESAHYLTGEILDESIMTFNYWKNVDLDDAPQTWKDVLHGYMARLEKIKKFSELLPEEARATFVKRLETILLRGIAAEGNLKTQEELVNFMKHTPTDLIGDTHREGQGYCGSFVLIIKEHRSSNFDIAIYFDQLIKIFYHVFPDAKNLD